MNKKTTKNFETKDQKSLFGILAELFFVFFKIGAFTFGGGYAMISVIEREVVGKKNWLTDEDFVNLVIIAESTPGVIAVNSATFTGYRRAGILGAIAATLGVIVPSLVIISIISYFFDAFRSNYWVNAIFTGISCCVPVLVFKAFIKLAKPLKFSWYNMLAVVAVFAVSLLTALNSIYLILIGGFIGAIAAYLIKPKETP